MVGDDPAPPAPKLLGEKDLSLALALADRLGVDLPMTTLALDRFAAEIALVERGLSRARHETPRGGSGGRGVMFPLAPARMERW